MIARTLATYSPFKKAFVFVLSVLFCSGFAFALSGCSNNSDEQRIAELEAEVERLQNELNSSDDQASTTQSQESTSSYTDATAQEFSDRADELIARAEATEVPSSYEARVDAFFPLDSEFNQLDNEIDVYEDQKEGEYRSGKLTWEEYRTIELELEQIEDRLDDAQDALEDRFGIDD